MRAIRWNKLARRDYFENIEFLRFWNNNQSLKNLYL